MLTLRDPGLVSASILVSCIGHCGLPITHSGISQMTYVVQHSSNARFTPKHLAIGGERSDLIYTHGLSPPDSDRKREVNLLPCGVRTLAVTYK